VQTKAFSVRATGFSLHVTGFSVRVTSFSPHTKGFRPHTKGFSACAKAFSADTKAFSPRAKAFSVHVKGFRVHTKGFRVRVKAFSAQVTKLSADAKCPNLLSLSLKTRFLRLETKDSGLNFKVLAVKFGVPGEDTRFSQITGVFPQHQSIPGRLPERVCRAQAFYSASQALRS
jgi:hypothetical protein